MKLRVSYAIRNTLVADCSHYVFRLLRVRVCVIPCMWTISTVNLHSGLDSSS